MSFLIIEPEASGSSGGRPSPGTVSCVFDYWLGDDLVRAYPAVLVTEPVKTALEALERPTGFTLTPARVTPSAFYRKHNPRRPLPSFWSIEVLGHAGRDDMGMTRAGQLVVSRRVLDVLLEFRIGRAVVAQYQPADQSPAEHDGDEADEHTG